MTLANCFTAFVGHRRLTSGPLAEVALAIKRKAKAAGSEPVLIFDDASGRSIDLDLRGTDREILARPPHSSPPSEAAELPASEPNARAAPSPSPSPSYSKEVAADLTTFLVAQQSDFTVHLTGAYTQNNEVTELRSNKRAEPVTPFMRQSLSTQRCLSE